MTRKYRAQIVVIMALVVATLIGTVALGTDIGLLYYNWGVCCKRRPTPRRWPARTICPETLPTRFPLRIRSLLKTVSR
jgi:hypothetical protein